MSNVKNEELASLYQKNADQYALVVKLRDEISALNLVIETELSKSSVLRDRLKVMDNKIKMVRKIKKLFNFI